MTCNPFLSGKFTTRCVVQFSTSEGGPLRLAWYSRAQLGGTSQRIFSGFITKNTVSSVESELIIQIKDTVTLCDGFSAYYCQVSFYNGTLLSKSQEIYLFPRYAFSNALRMCDEHSIQSSHIAECVDPQFSTTDLEAPTPPSIPMTTSPLTATTVTLLPTKKPLSEVTTLPSTSMPPLIRMTPSVTTKTVPTTTEHTLLTESPPITESHMTVPSVTKVSMTDTLPPTMTSSQSITTSSLLTTKPSSVTSESQPATPTHPLTTEISPQTTKSSPSTMLTEASLSTAPSATTMSTPLVTESSPTTSESLMPVTESGSSPGPLISMTPDSPSPQSDSQAVSTAPPSPQSPPLQAPSSTTDGDPSTESEVGSGRFDDEALLFLTLGAAIFLLILISCIVFCLCLWSDSCRQCGYEICCSDECCCTCSCCLCLDDI